MRSPAILRREVESQMGGELHVFATIIGTAVP
jgi:hypothetical protein